MENSFVNFDEKNLRFDQPVSFLVVDDDARARESLSMLLQRKWSDITEAEDGEVAISLIEQRQFKIIILDLNMPKKSGDQVLAFIRDRAAGEARLIFLDDAHRKGLGIALRRGIEVGLQSI